jgi:uncharacterized protein (DUF1800 family)/regulation of enolase protein 1 (concanavalin A-like superfamily)
MLAVRLASRVTNEPSPVLNQTDPSDCSPSAADISRIPSAPRVRSVVLEIQSPVNQSNSVVRFAPAGAGITASSRPGAIRNVTGNQPAVLASLKALCVSAALLVSANTSIAAPGLSGEYHSIAGTTGNPPRTPIAPTSTKRVDPTVNFNWASGSPMTGIGVDRFAVRWTGSVQPLYTEQYTFFTRSDDGVRLWVDGQLLVDNWTLHSATENSGTIALQAGRSYNVQLEFFENTGQAVAQLSWSSPSQAKSIIPQTQLATIQDWASADVGTPGAPGDATYEEATGQFTIRGSGTDIWNTADAFHYVNQPLFGDGEIVARVASIQNTHEWARIGLMIRESTASNSKHASVFVTPGRGLITQVRQTTGGTSTYTDSGLFAAPVWLKLSRKGSVFTSSTSVDGVTWQTAATVVVNLPSRSLVGLAVCSHANSTLNTAVFDNVTALQGLRSAADADADGIDDSWETANAFDPANAADATADADADGFSNRDEFIHGTNPRSANTAGTVTVQAIDASAYEKEGTRARFRIERSGTTLPVTINYTLAGRATAYGLTGADYTPESSSRAVRTASIVLPGGATSADLFIRPTLDTANEYPEDVALTISSNARYTLGTTTATSANLFDATNTTANEQLFVAFLGAQGTARTYASGIATLFLNGQKNSARVSLSFSGLTSNQTNAYIRYGVTSGVGPELRPTLPSGQVTNQTWNIVQAGTITGQDIIDGLFQSLGKWVYINIGTGNYPAGEIAGILTKQTGSTTFTPPADPPAIEALSGDGLTRDVSRFLTQATFGPTQADITALVNRITSQHGGDRIAGYNAWIDEQFALDQTKLHDYTYAADTEEWSRRGTSPSSYVGGQEPNQNNRRRGWWLLATKAHDQLRQRAAFAFSEVWVISEYEALVRDRHYGAAAYYDMLGSHVTGNFRDLLESVSKSPMMGRYLSHLKNQKAIINPTTGQVIVSPDENYAREIMQLFSIGLVHRHPDGSLKLGSDGLPIATYTNADITELARVFTGWSFSKVNGSAATGYPVLDNTNFNAGNGPKYFQAAWLNPMKNFPAYHDVAAKTVLSTSIPAGLDGEADLDAAHNILFNHPNTAPFISRLLIQRLVTSNPSSGYIYRVAQKFVDNGSGARGDMKAVIKAILIDYEARSLDVVSNIGYGKQKEPILRYVQLLRALDGKSLLQLSDLSSHGYPATQLDNFPAGTTRYRYGTTDTPLSQTPQRSPTVFNWFLPDYNPGGAIASAGLVAPEMQLANETSVVAAINYHYTMAQGDTGQSVDALYYPAPGVPAANTNDDNVRLDRTPLVTMYDAAFAAEPDATKKARTATTTVLDHLDVLLCAGNLKGRYGSSTSPNPRNSIVDAVSTMSTTTVQRTKELIYLVVTSPEYLHQK